MSWPTPPPEASELSLFRVLPDGRGRAYTHSKGSWELIERTIRMAAALGRIVRHDEVGAEDCYGVLDVRNGNCDIVADFCIPDAEAFRWWYRQLDARVASEDIPRPRVAS